MRKRSTSDLVTYTLETLPPSESDWARVDAMSDEEVIAAAMSDPDGPPLTKEQLARMRRALPPVDVSALRARLGMSQLEFATTFRIPPGVLQEWEEGRSQPDRCAHALLTVIDRDPDAVRRALAA